MRRWIVFVPLLAISLAFFVLASQAADDTTAFFLAVIGAVVPVLGAMLLVLINTMRWRRMASDLGLVLRGGGAYPDLVGRYQGRRLTVLRRTDPLGHGPREATVLRLEGVPEVRLPGTVADASVVTGVLEPLVADYQKTSEPVAR